MQGSNRANFLNIHNSFHIGMLRLTTLTEASIVPAAEWLAKHAPVDCFVMNNIEANPDQPSLGDNVTVDRPESPESCDDKPPTGLKEGICNIW